MRKCRECDFVGIKEDFPKAGEIKGIMYYRHLCDSCYGNSKNNYRDKQIDKFNEYKKKLSCNRCGFSDYRAIEFHHPNNDKEFNIADYTRRVSFESLLKEILKCEPICANCHRIHHHEIREIINNNKIK